MRVIYKTAQFKKDFKKIQKRRLPIKELEKVLRILVTDGVLPEKYKDHRLVGNYVNTRECHIKPDWLLIYAITDDALKLIRTGSHSDLF